MIFAPVCNGGSHFMKKGILLTALTLLLFLPVAALMAQSPGESVVLTEKSVVDILLQNSFGLKQAESIRDMAAQAVPKARASSIQTCRWMVLINSTRANALLRYSAIELTPGSGTSRSANRSQLERFWASGFITRGRRPSVLP